MNRTDAFHQALEKYRLSAPIPTEIQAHIMRTRRTSLKILLKKTGKYGTLSALSIIIYLVIRKIGVAISLFQAKVVALATAGAVAVSASAGSYVAARHVYRIIQKSSIESTAVEMAKPDVKADADVIIDGKKSAGPAQADSKTTAPSGTNAPTSTSPVEKRDAGMTGKNAGDKPASEPAEPNKNDPDKKKAEIEKQPIDKKIHERTGNVPTL